MDYLYQVFLVFLSIVTVLLIVVRCKKRVPQGNQQEQAQARHVEQGQGRQPTLPDPTITLLLLGRVVVYNSQVRIGHRCSECVICLEDFKDGDSCKVLSKCNHMYHTKCIDRWLIKDRHCPLCRGSVRGSNRGNQSNNQNPVLID
ncbi:hypothetical protein Tsubulata_014954 [Turnera subulata]|uniref:RING-type domain-containing protein n=1 Tax=Turnera subulata TaxID=218843 RepID=A0A9Q0F9E4_9ROSI|nr:hypothetical protein Tsubulata_014954 [Turnera subulata]